MLPIKSVKKFLLFSCTALIIVTIVRLPRALVGVGEMRFSYSQNRSTPPVSRQAELTPFVTIVSCIKGRSTHFLEHTLLPSIYETITNKERASYRVELILGYDHDDEYWQQNHNHQLSPKEYGGTIYDDHEPIPINYVAIRKDPNGERPNRIPFNELCQAAYDYGATYIVRINDDSQFSTPGWITVATKALQSFSPPNVGVVGPTCHQGNLDIMTHDFVHAPTHYSIFDTYYPQVFDNYYVDDWITHVYGEKRTRKLKDWEVEHHLTTFWTRYKPTFHQDKLLDQLVKEGRESVEKIILKKKRLDMNGIDGGSPSIPLETQRDALRVLGTKTIERVDGPMQEVHWSFMR